MLFIANLQPTRIDAPYHVNVLKVAQDVVVLVLVLIDWYHVRLLQPPFVRESVVKPLQYGRAGGESTSRSTKKDLIALQCHLVATLSYPKEDSREGLRPFAPDPVNHPVFGVSETTMVDFKHDLLGKFRGHPGFSSKRVQSDSSSSGIRFLLH